MKLAILVALGSPLLVFTLPCAELAEILRGPWRDIREQFHFHTAQWFACCGALCLACIFEPGYIYMCVYKPPGRGYS